MNAGAMILAAGRGERMRPLSDVTPKPLLAVGGEALIVHQLRALVRAGLHDVVINVSHLADKLVDALGDGHRHGARIRWSREAMPLEAAGGIATALPLLPPGPALVVSGDIWTDFDYATLNEVVHRMRADAASPRVHLVMVPNPDYHAGGDFVLSSQGAIRAGDGQRLTYGNIGIYDTALFRDLPRGVPLKLLPYLSGWIAEGRVSGQRYEGRWANVGTPADLAALDATLAGRSPQKDHT